METINIGVQMKRAFNTVEVIRCKECKNWNLKQDDVCFSEDQQKIGACGITHHFRKEMDYCSYSIPSVTAHWEKEDENDFVFHCSNCCMPSDIPFPRCHSCGMVMDEQVVTLR